MGDKYSKKSIKTTRPKRINFNTFGTPTAIKGVRHYSLPSGHGRDFKVSDIEQLQDSLLARKEYNDARRLAVLATSLDEAGELGFASRGIGGNGMLGLSEDRMPLSYVGAGPEIGGKQINHNLTDLRTRHSDNWLNGGTGGPVIMSGKDGYDKFWNENDVRKATIYLNKSYIRPRDREDAWNNRAAAALLLQQAMLNNNK